MRASLCGGFDVLLLWAIYASSLYNNLNGVKPVVLDVVVLWDQTILGNSSTHLPLRRPNNILDIAENTTLFALSTAPLDSGW